MSPYERLEAAYAANPKEEPLENYVRLHLRTGFVFSRPDFFCMGRPVVRSAPAGEILDPRVSFPIAECDAWYVHAAAGDLSKMWEILPWRLGWCCWTRVDDPLSALQIIPTERLRRLRPPRLE